MLKLEKYSMGIGDRFSKQGAAQLSALVKAAGEGLELVPVWNKSNREHQIIGTHPEATWGEAEAAVKELNWKASWYVDADHINLGTVDRFMDHANFFTLDVADYIGKEVDEASLAAFMKEAEPYLGKLPIPGLEDLPEVNRSMLEEISRKYLGAIQEATRIYTHIKEHKGGDSFITEVSMDEVEEAQSPVELFFILLMISKHGIPAQTIAPKFTGRFNKGVDYVGDLELFRKEFEEDLLVISYAVKEFSLPENLKLSIHSGSDKFSIYPIMGELIKEHDAGIHVKTAGTTWLEEVVGLALAGGEALELAREIYRKAYERQEELCGPYATVIDIDPETLPLPDEVDKWDGQRYADTLRHIPGHPEYHAGFRQLVHVAYKVAAEMGDNYLELLDKNKELVGQQVSTNIFTRHIKRLF